jgi:DNA mismatch repair protein MSH6
VVTESRETVTITGAQAQWWRIKAEHFDCVSLFKVGKFYEMFEMDAHVGAQVLGLLYMKGDQPHCGFPEKNYEAHAERLARAGHRVVVVEQVETPDQMEARNKAKGTKDKVVRRNKARWADAAS